MSILVITTGGTIGAMACDDPGNPPEVRPMPPDGIDFIRDALAREFTWADTRCMSAEPRDSKNIDAAYLAQLEQMIGNAPEKNILVTHGTDRILQTADFLFGQRATNVSLCGKTIILTGAMIPLANGAQSEGYLNLEFALRQFAKPGVGPGVSIVLCDFEDSDAESGPWAPRLYAYQPGVYHKVYATDARYSRLKGT